MLTARAASAVPVLEKRIVRLTRNEASRSTAAACSAAATATRTDVMGPPPHERTKWLNDLNKSPCSDLSLMNRLRPWYLFDYCDRALNCTNHVTFVVRSVAKELRQRHSLFDQRAIYTDV